MFDAEIKNLKSFNSYLIHLVESKLWLKVIIALVLGVLVGFMFSPEIGWISTETSQIVGNWLALPSKLFLKLVQMIMIPLIFASIISGIASNDLGQLKKMGLGVTGYFVLTTVVSIVIGTALALFFAPGELLQEANSGLGSVSSLNAQTLPNWAEIPNRISNLLPDNPLASMVSGEMLSIVIFTIIIGIAIVTLSDKVGRPILSLLSSVQEICMVVVNWAMRLVPIAVFGLMVQLTSNIGFNSLAGIGYYVFVVMLGLLLLLLFYVLILYLVCKVNPFKFLRQIVDVQLLAFSTTSSAAVMPLSLKTAEDKLHIKPSISNFIIPIGATINMDGTALYQCITTLFIAQAYGFEMSIFNIILVMVTIVAASIGTPAIPGGGVIVLASVLQSVGIPAEGIIIIIGVERILGMFRSALNVTGDLVAATAFNRWYGNVNEIEKEVVGEAQKTP